MIQTLNKELKKRWGLTISLVLFVFAIMMAAILLTGLIFFALNYSEYMSLWAQEQPELRDDGWTFGILIPPLAVSILIGTAMTAFFSKKALNPIRKVIAATHRIAEGDFNTRVDLRGIYEMEELSQSFNKMASELSSIETLRRDFINNFSHEFKTPIASISGFAKLLRESNLQETEKQEYLEIIINESERLTALSTNILNLTKYENLEIISDKTAFRLDEQIRRIIVLTEPKWAEKELRIEPELEETLFWGNEDILQQIWLNLMDNAIKFSNPGGAIYINLAKCHGGIRFIIRDEGTGIAETALPRIFDKFYQGDLSRTKTGNGIGLAIVKQITDLCGGSIEVQSVVDKGSTFTVFLPEGEGRG